jgi:hypothetical protein
MGSEIAIKNGLYATDQVVIAGQQNLHEGASALLVAEAK